MKAARCHGPLRLIRKVKPLTDTITELRDTALLYTAQGWPVFPCQPGSKIPAMEHGCKDATTNPDIIRSWWSDYAWNVAIATGAPGPDVLDVDNKGDAGWGAYNRLRRAGLLAGACALVRTRSGGLHVYFTGTDQRNAAHIGGVALDFRAAGGYVLAPPSTVDGGRYEVLEKRSQAGTFDLASARLLLDPPRARFTRSAGQPKPGDTGRLAAWVGQLQEGERNHGLFWAACRAAEAGSDTEPLIGAAVECGLGEYEARRTVDSAVRTAGR